MNEYVVTFYPGEPGEEVWAHLNLHKRWMEKAKSCTRVCVRVWGVHYTHTWSRWRGMRNGGDDFGKWPYGGEEGKISWEGESQHVTILGSY